MQLGGGDMKPGGCGLPPPAGGGRPWVLVKVIPPLNVTLQSNAGLPLDLGRGALAHTLRWRTRSTTSTSRLSLRRRPWRQRPSKQQRRQPLRAGACAQ